MKLPRHVAIIMDGNGRWARSRGLPRIAGHKIGVDSVKETIKVAVELKLEILTLFAFSTENWQRPQEEVGYLLSTLLFKVLEDEIDDLNNNNIQLRVIGDLSRLEQKLQDKINYAIDLTGKNSGLKLVIALNYSGKWDIIQATRKIATKIEQKELSSDSIDDDILTKHLATYGLTDPDLLIRTSGEIRISNFMLWQLAYTELYFTETLWPDFRRKEFIKAIEFYHTRERRFGRC